MLIFLFFLLQSINLFGLVIAWKVWRNKRELSSNTKIIATIMASLAFLIIVAKGLLSQRQDWDAYLFPPVFLYVVFTSLLWYTCPSLLFGGLSTWAKKPHERRALFMLTLIFTGVLVIRSYWLVWPPAVYTSDSKAQKDGVVYQTSTPSYK